MSEQHHHHHHPTHCTAPFKSEKKKQEWKKNYRGFDLSLSLSSCPLARGEGEPHSQILATSFSFFFFFGRFCRFFLLLLLLPLLSLLLFVKFRAGNKQKENSEALIFFWGRRNGKRGEGRSENGFLPLQFSLFGQTEELIAQIFFSLSLFWAKKWMSGNFLGCFGKGFARFGLKIAPVSPFFSSFLSLTTRRTARSRRLEKKGNSFRMLRQFHVTNKGARNPNGSNGIKLAIQSRHQGCRPTGWMTEMPKT